METIKKRTILQDINHYGPIILFFIVSPICLFALLTIMPEPNQTHINTTNIVPTKTIQTKQNNCISIAKINYKACIDKCISHTFDGISTINGPNGSYTVYSGPNYLCGNDCDVEYNRQTNLCNINN